MTATPFAEFLLNLAKILRMAMAVISGIVERVAQGRLWKGIFFSFQCINEEFAAGSKRSRDCAEAYSAVRSRRNY
jgi:hypothetical protein